MSVDKPWSDLALKTTPVGADELAILDSADAVLATKNKRILINSLPGIITSYKIPVRAATTVNGTLATAYENGDTIDGVTLVTGNRILLKNQSTGAENGIYTVKASGAPDRATDFASGLTSVAGSLIPVEEGTANNDLVFIVTTNNPTTVGTTALTFRDIASAINEIWSKSGSNIFQTTLTDKVGIGINSPTELFHVNNGNSLLFGGDSTLKPHNPTRLFTLTDATNLNVPRRISIVDNHAYVVSETGNSLTVIDISIPTAPVILTTFIDGTNLMGPQGLFVAGRYAYIACKTGNSLTVIDISTPSSPTFKSKMTVANASNVYVSGIHAYVISAADSKLTIIDIHDPTNITLDGSVTDTGKIGGASDVYVSGIYAYVTGETSDSLSIIDVSNDATPTITGTFTDITNMKGPKGVYVVGNHAYVVSDVSDSFVVVDVGVPATPALRGTLIDPTFETVKVLNGANAVFVAENHAYVTSSNADSVTIINVSTHTAPVVVGAVVDGTNLNDVASIAITGKLVCVASPTNKSFSIIDIHGIVSPTGTIGSLEVGTLNVRDNVIIADDLYSSTLNVGNSALVGGQLSVSEKFEVFGDAVIRGTLQLRNPANTFQYSIVTAAITANRTITLPLLAANDIFVTANFVQTLTNKTLTTPTIVATGFTNMQHTHQAANTGGQLVGTLALTATGTKDSTTFLRGDNTWATPLGSAPPFVDSTALVKGSADATKLLRFEVDGNTTGITGVISTIFTTTKTITIPDATDTLVARTTTDTLTNKTLTTPTIASFVNATHNHSNAAGGGNLTNSALTSGVFSSITGLGTQSQVLNMGSNKITLVTDPTAAQDAATKNYVDSIAINGIKWKESVKVASTGNLTLSGEQTIDGISTSTDRILVKNQSLGQNNGIYVTAAGAWSRSTDADTAAEILQMAVFVEEGTSNADQGFVLTTNTPIIIDTTVLVYTQFTGLGQITAGTNLSKTTNTINWNPTGGVDFLSAVVTNMGTLNTHTIPTGTDTFTMIAATQTLTNKTLTTPTIASFVNATHNHQAAAGGSTLVATSALTATGTTDSTTFLRGDNTWATPVGAGDMVLAGIQIVTGKKTFGSIGGAVDKFALAGSTSGSTILNAAAVAGAGTVVLPITGTLATLAQTETLLNKTLTTPTIVATGFTNMQHTHQAANTGGQLVGTLALTATGTKDNTTFLRGDDTWATPAGAGDMVLAGIQIVTGKKTFGSIGGAVDKFALAGSTSGSTILNAAAVAGAGTVVLPITGTLATLNGTEILTLKTLTTPTIASFVNATHNHQAAAGGSTLVATSALTATGTKDSTTFLRGDDTWATPAGGAPPFIDSTALVKGSADDTKLLRFEVDGNTTAITGVISTIFTTTKTITIPDATDTLVGKNTTDILTNKSISLTNNVLTGTSAQLATAISDETGAGSLVFGTSPVIVTPTIASFVNATHNHQNAAGGGTLLSTSALSDTANIAYLNTANVFGDFNQIFKNNRLRIENPAATFEYQITASAIVADRVVTLPLLTGDDTFTMIAATQTLTNKTLTTPTIASFVNATHNHTNAAGGGNIAAGGYAANSIALADIAVAAKTEVLMIAASNESTALTTGTAKTTFRMPYAFNLTAVRASLTTAGTGAALVTVDINESGTTILSTKITIDATEKTSTTAATAPVISDSALADDAEITIDIDTIDTGGVSAGLKIYLIGNQT